MVASVSETLCLWESSNETLARAQLLKGLKQLVGFHSHIYHTATGNQNPESNQGLLAKAEWEQQRFENH